LRRCPLFYCVRLRAGLQELIELSVDGVEAFGEVEAYLGLSVCMTARFACISALRASLKSLMRLLL
jgi:hypothetical protein